jgi:hypothetical protein
VQEEAAEPSQESIATAFLVSCALTASSPNYLSLSSITKSIYPFLLVDGCSSKLPILSSMLNLFYHQNTPSSYSNVENSSLHLIC